MLGRDKRHGANFLTANWPQLLLNINGLNLDVIGGENLTAKWPAVFIFYVLKEYVGDVVEFRFGSASTAKG